MNRFLLVCILALTSPAPLAATSDEATRALARDIFKELIEIDTTDTPAGNVTTASAAMAKRLKAGGFADADVRVVGPSERKKNLVVRLKGTGHKKPLLLIGHLDVVAARREDWTTDPFKFVEKDGYFYGRGTQDMKHGCAIMVATLIRMKQEGFKPNRDIILALTADEEGGTANGVDWLLNEQRALVDAEFVLNHDGESVLTDKGRPYVFEINATEKVYADFRLTVTNAGGHSSVPVPDNAIYQLARGLDRLAKYEFPFELNAATRAYYEKAGKLEPEHAADILGILRTPPDAAAIARLSKDAVHRAQTHTTCVATRLDGGHANNALPQRARALVNCRILPGHPLEEVRKQIVAAVADSKLAVTWVTPEDGDAATAPERKAYAPAPIPADVMQPLEGLVARMWPGIPIVPQMSAGATDGVFTTAAGMPTYVIAGVALARDDLRAHGRDERIGVESFNKGVDFYYQFLKGVTTFTN